MVVHCENCGNEMTDRYATVMLPKKVKVAPECPDCVNINKEEWSDAWDEY